MVMPSSRLKRILYHNETIRYDGGFSCFTLIPSMVWVIPSVYFYHLCLDFPTWDAVVRTFFGMLTVFCFVMGVRDFMRAMVDLVFTSIIVTNCRVFLLRDTYISEVKWDVPLHSIESVEVERGMGGIVLGYGDVMIKGVGGTIAIIKMVSRPRKLQYDIMDMLNRGTVQ